MRISLLQSVEDLAHAEVLRRGAGVLDRDVHVVEQDHAAVGHLRQPRVEIVAHRLEGVRAVDMQQVHGLVGEEMHGLVEVLAHQLGHAGIIGGEIVGDFAEQLFVEPAHVDVALPQVDPEAFRVQRACFDGLAERGERRPAVRAELDDDLRPQPGDDLEGERNVTDPPR